VTSVDTRLHEKLLLKGSHMLIVSTADLHWGIALVTFKMAVKTNLPYCKEPTKNRKCSLSATYFQCLSIFFVFVHIFSRLKHMRSNLCRLNMGCKTIEWCFHTIDTPFVSEISYNGHLIILFGCKM
jgi:hypothetical protein